MLALFGGVPGVLVGGRVADRYASRFVGGRLALPAVFLAVGTACFTASYLHPARTSTRWPPSSRCSCSSSLGLFIVTMAIPGLRAGLTDAIPAHLRGAGFGAFNLVSVVCGQAAAPFVVGALSSAFDENLRTAFLLVTPFSFLGAADLVPRPPVPRRRHAEDHDGGP